jgi:hypothetical protein
MPSYHHPPYNPFAKGRVPSSDPCYGLKYPHEEVIKLNFVVAVLLSIGIMTYQLVTIALYFTPSLFRRTRGLPLWYNLAIACFLLVCFVFRENYNWANPRRISMISVFSMWTTFWSLPIVIIVYISVSYLVYYIAGADTPE